MAELTDGTAELRVLVTTALGALPLENAIVSVSTAPDDTGMRTLLYSVTTDSGGMTPSMILTTPPRSNSLSPGSGPPFAVYTVEISAEGYTPLTALHIAMFSGVPTMLPVALASAAMYAVVRLTAAAMPPGHALLRVAAEVAAGCASYLLVSLLFRLEAFRQVVSLLKKQAAR